MAPKKKGRGPARRPARKPAGKRPRKPTRRPGWRRVAAAEISRARSAAGKWIAGIERPPRRQVEYGGLAILALALAITGITVRATRESGTKRLVVERVAHLREPVAIAQPPGRSELVVVEKRGLLKVVGESGVVGKPLLDIRKAVKTSGKGGEQGLLSVAFPQDFPKTRRYYVSYTNRRDDLRVVEYRTRDSSRLSTEPNSRRILLTIPEPTPQHHSGHLEFGPDGFLYIGSGDGGPTSLPGARARDRRSLLGKILRVDPSGTTGRPGRRNWLPYRIPTSNPFVGRPGRDEIYALGLRNPWSFSFDRSTGALIVSDVGNSRIEEVNHLPAGKGLGADFGWPAFEGTATFRGGVPRARTVIPAVAYPHGPACSVVGGVAVRDP